MLEKIKNKANRLNIGKKKKNYCPSTSLSFQSKKRPLLDIGIPQKRRRFAIIITLGRRFGDRSRVLTNKERTLLLIL